MRSPVVVICVYFAIISFRRACGLVAGTNHLIIILARAPQPHETGFRQRPIQTLPENGIRAVIAQIDEGHLPFGHLVSLRGHSQNIQRGVSASGEQPMCGERTDHPAPPSVRTNEMSSDPRKPHCKALWRVDAVVGIQSSEVSRRCQNYYTLAKHDPTAEVIWLRRAGFAAPQPVNYQVNNVAAACAVNYFLEPDYHAKGTAVD
jgi:hypothetical protein